MNRCTHGGAPCRRHGYQVHETPGDFWRALGTFTLLIAALYVLVLVGAASQLPVPQ